jgi:hypothetical protein
MNKIEKRELVEQQRNVFEAGMRRADKRTGSFSFLTWAFFLAPLMVSKEFLGGKIVFAAAADEHTTAKKIAALHPVTDDPPARDLSQAGGENETPNGTGSSSALHSTELDSRGGRRRRPKIRPTKLSSPQLAMVPKVAA